MRTHKEMAALLSAALEGLEKYTGHFARVEACVQIRQVKAALESPCPICGEQKPLAKG